MFCLYFWFTVFKMYFWPLNCVFLACMFSGIFVSVLDYFSLWSINARIHVIHVHIHSLMEQSNEHLSLCVSVIHFNITLGSVKMYSGHEINGRSLLCDKIMGIKWSIDHKHKNRMVRTIYVSLINVFILHPKTDSWPLCIWKDALIYDPSIEMIL